MFKIKKKGSKNIKNQKDYHRFPHYLHFPTQLESFPARDNVLLQIVSSCRKLLPGVSPLDSKIFDTREIRVTLNE